jgi:hypothetical protein
MKSINSLWLFFVFQFVDFLGDAQLSAEDHMQDKRVDVRLVLDSCRSSALNEAIRQTQDTLDDFVLTFKNRGMRQDSFFATFLVDRMGTLRPFGLKLRKTTGTKLLGTIYDNNGELTNEQEVEIDHSQVIDWRFVDCNETFGAMVYRQQVSGASLAVKKQIRSSGRMWLREGQESCDKVIRADFSNIANLSGTGLSSFLEKSQLANDRYLLVPYRQSWNKDHFGVTRLNILEYAAAYGTYETLTELEKHNYLTGHLRLAFIALFVGNMDTFRYLIRNDFDPNLKDPDFKTTLLHIACRASNVEAVRMLLSKGANVNEYDSACGCPIHLVNDVRCATLLILAKAELNARDHAGYTALDRMIMRSRPDSADLIRKNGGKHSGLDIEIDETIPIEGVRSMIQKHAMSEGSNYDSYIATQPGFFLPKNELFLQ